MIGRRGGVPLYRLVAMGPGGRGEQVTLDGLTLIPLSRWLWRRLHARHPRWPAAIPTPAMSTRGLPRIVTLVITDRGMAERLYDLLSDRALETASLLLDKAHPDAWSIGDDDDGEVAEADGEEAEDDEAAP